MGATTASKPPCWPPETRANTAGLPVTAIITMTLEQVESASGLTFTGGGSTVSMEVAIRMAALADHYLYIYGLSRPTNRPARPPLFDVFR